MPSSSNARLDEDNRPVRYGRASSPNAEAHITSALAGRSLTIPIPAGKLLLRAWGSILPIKLDEPRQRQASRLTIESPRV